MTPALPWARRSGSRWRFEARTGAISSGRVGVRPSCFLLAVYTAKAGLSLCCPVTTRAKGYPFEVPLPEGLGIDRVVLADHAKSLDWQARNVEPAGRVPEATLAEIADKLSALLSG